MDIQRAGKAEMDEIWGFVGKKQAQRWLYTGVVLAYVFGRRKAAILLQRTVLLDPCGFTRYYTDHWGAYTRQLARDMHSPGKRNT